MMSKKIIIVGNGKLSKSLQSNLTNNNLCIFDKSNIKKLASCQADILIDCSLPSAFEDIHSYLINHQIPAIICSTGHDEKQIQKLKTLSNSIPIFKSENFSLGISLIKQMLKDKTSLLSNYDCHLIDIHHENKIDSPSGTSLFLSSNLKNINHISIRSKNVIGEHKILLISDDEEIAITHKITSRDVFAKGIILAIRYIDGKKNGLYTMEDLTNEMQ